MPFDRVPSRTTLLPVACAAFALTVAPSHAARADALTDRLTQFAAQQTATVSIDSWKFHQPDIAGGERPNVDDSAWPTVAPGKQWTGAYTNVWFRTKYTVPATVNGISTVGTELVLQVGMDDYAEVYVDGKFRDRSHWDDGHVLLTAHARPGQTFLIAVRGVNEPGLGQLHFGRVVYDLIGPVQPDYDRYIREAQFVAQAAGASPAPADRVKMAEALKQSEAQVNMGALRAHDWKAGGASLAAARRTLLTLAPITRPYDVYYVGHAHIDMNWLWPWTETIDVCHRTWNSAMNLMDQFPDFGFVQSQPGAYRAIQQQYPEEFARMQAEAAKGQWDTVSGFYDESDTNIPSGEGLARSLFLGQRFFKTNFGHYAETGWLPDSFGHSWQVPQLLQNVGIQNYYHTRCGDGIRYAWWESPDGTRVLKANTDSYDEPIAPEQLMRPFADQGEYGVKEALVVFGVGDHGGGPTRDMIEAGKEMQGDPLFPKVHFVTADAYFDHLRETARRNESKPDTAASIPVVDTDLQYTFVGCYTTHADMKKAVRSSENNLYSAEVFSSLAAMNAAQPYPVADFEEAWRPTAFAQFHDILCGSAIHSTYDWMHQQLAPAFAFESAQTGKALAALTATVDTHAAKAGEIPVVVWNALSAPRTDVVRVTIPEGSPVNAARDEAGRWQPAQALDSHTLAFVAAQAPAFGHRTYMLGSVATRQLYSPLVRETPEGFVLDNGIVRAAISRATGALNRLTDVKTGREWIAPGQAGNVLQVLGDRGNAWDITYTGEEHDLTTGAEVQVLQNGPVCAIVRVRHTFGKSTFTQDVTMYRDLARIDVPTTVEWHERGQLLKVAFPLAMAHPSARVGIPYGSIVRPTSGQENPGQKWMDVTETSQSPIGDAAPLPLPNALFNQSSAVGFDGDRRGYPADQMPAAGVHRFGGASIPFALAARGGADNIACDGQRIPASAVSGDTLFVLGAGAPGSQYGTLTFVRADGSRGTASVRLGDWVVGGVGSNESGVVLPFRLETTGQRDAVNKPHLWIAAVKIPAGGSPLAQIVLPHNPKLHIFALTIGLSAKPTPLYGLTVLNDCKYGSDTNGSTFRLTLLRSSGDPDPNPDEGTQRFTYALLPHYGDPRAAGAEQAGLALNIPLAAIVTDAHTGTGATPGITVGPESVVVGALKHAEDGPGYIVRVFETRGVDTVARLDFGQRVQVEETDILERPVRRRKIEGDGKGAVRFPIGHDQIVTLHITGLPDAGIAR